MQNEFSWSSSRARSFSICKRKYYFQYYGHWGGWLSKSDDLTKKIYLLKKMTSIPQLIGSIIHFQIENILKELKKGSIVSRDKVLKESLNSFKRSWNESKEKKWKQSPKDFTNLFEHYYSVGQSREDLLKVKDKIETCISGFFDSDSYKFIKQVSNSDILSIEQLSSFDFENTKVYVNLDFALKHDGKIYIYDWKTGQKVQEDERQLSVYAMYANQRWDKNYDLIRIFDVYIYSNLPVKVKLNIKSIHDTKKYLRKSIKEMKSSLVDDEKNIASIDNFPMIENINICNRCQYKSLCYPENWKNLK